MWQIPIAEVWRVTLQERCLTSLDILVRDGLNVRRRALVALEHDVISLCDDPNVITCENSKDEDVKFSVPL